MLAEYVVAVRRARCRRTEARRHRCSSARPTWTSSRWARRAKRSYFGPVKNPWDPRMYPAAVSGGIGGRRRCAARRRRHRHRHRRIDPPAGGAFRHLRIEADVRHAARATASSRSRRASTRRARSRNRADDLRAAAQCDGGPRRARLDLARRAPPRTTRASSRRGRREAARRRLRIGLPREYFGAGIDTRCRRGDRSGARRVPQRSARRPSTSRCANVGLARSRSTT